MRAPAAAAASAVALGRGATAFLVLPAAQNKAASATHETLKKPPASPAGGAAEPGHAGFGLAEIGGLGVVAAAALSAAQGFGTGWRAGAARTRAANAAVVVRAFESELGVQAPVGFWDPLGLSKDGDVESFKRRRETELKHGRVSMYAAMGYIVPEYYKFPGYLSPSQSLTFDEIPNGLRALGKVPSDGILQWVLFCGFFELVINQKTGEPGNFGKGWLGMGAPMADADARKRCLNAELANGRLAMMAIMGMMFQDGLTGQAWGDWALYTDSPLRG